LPALRWIEQPCQSGSDLDANNEGFVANLPDMVRRSGRSHTGLFNVETDPRFLDEKRRSNF